MARRRPSILAALILVVAACAAPSTSAGPSSATTIPPASAATESNPPSAPAPTVSASTDPAPTALAAGPASWGELEPAGPKPAAREDGTWTAQPGTRTAYLFGGRDGNTVFNDLWAFDLDADRWTELTPAGAPPPARFGHEGVWVDGIGVVIFAGQAGPTTFFDDLWAYDPTADRWAALQVTGSRPKARYGTCAAVGPDGRLWISHGFTEDGTRFADTQAFDFEAGQWSDVTPAGDVPVSRCLHGCWWTDDGRFALYAGQTTGVGALGDLWTLVGAGTPAAAWARSTGDLPPDRNLYAFARHGGGVIVVGGRGLGSAFLDDTFAIDATTLAVQPLDPQGTKPPGRAGAMLIDDAEGGRVVLFGGKTGDGSLGDLWDLSLD